MTTKSNSLSSVLAMSMLANLEGRRYQPLVKFCTSFKRFGWTQHVIEAAVDELLTEGLIESTLGGPVALTPMIRAVAK